MAKYLDATGLAYFKDKIVTLLSGKVDKVTGKGLSTNDYTNEDKSKLESISSGANTYTHPAYTPHESGLYKVTVDATGHVSAVAPIAKADITNLGIPGTNTTYSPVTATANGLMSKDDKAKLDAFSPSNAYALKTDITAMYKYKGSKATQAALPATGNTAGDVWNVEEDGMNYAWTGSAWDALGGSISIDTISNSDIDAMF